MGIELIQKAASILSVEYAREPPWLILEWLHILDFNEQHVTWLGGFDLEGPGQIMYAGQVNIAHVVCRVIVLDLPACPVDAFDLYDFAVLDRCAGWDWVGGVRLASYIYYPAYA